MPELDMVKGLFGLFGAICAAVFGAMVREVVVRARSRTKVRQAEDDAQVSVLTEVRAEKVAAVLREAALLKQIDDLQERLRNLQTKVTVTQMLAASDPAMSAKVALDSAFIDSDRPLRPHPAPRPPSSHDVFQANVQYTPPKGKK